MAATAEVLNIETDGFDWDLAEVQFSAAPVNSRNPESEIYGRSLSTIFKLGSFMVGKAIRETIHSPEADQARVEFYTSVEEGFGTDPELGGGLEVRGFDTRPIIDGKVRAKNNKAICEMADDGLTCAKAQTDPRFLPQLVRTQRDHDNVLIVDQMARREVGYNTRIVVSPFPEEAAAESGNDYWRKIGYVPHLKRGFVQVYHLAEKELIAGSLSFDGSNKERLKDIFSRRGIKIPDGEVTDNWLKYAITGNFSEDEAKALGLEIADEAHDPKYKKITNTVDVTQEYGSIMDKVFNGSYIHACESLARGHQTPEARKLIFQLADKAGSFNGRYAKALYEMRANENQFTDDDMVVLHELLVYSAIEMMRALHLQKLEPNYQHKGFDPAYFQAMNPAMLQATLGSFAAEGAINNRTYSACGVSISLGENGLGDAISGVENLQTAFAGLGSEKLSWHGGKVKKGKCVSCKKTTDVGVKSWCQKCIKC